MRKNFVCRLVLHHYPSRKCTNDLVPALDLDEAGSRYTRID